MVLSHSGWGAGLGLAFSSPAPTGICQPLSPGFPAGARHQSSFSCIGYRQKCRNQEEAPRRDTLLPSHLLSAVAVVKMRV